MRKYEELCQLMGGYLHEDFAEEFGSPWNAVDSFVDGSPDWAPLVSSQIREILASVTSEEDLAQVVHHVLGSAYSVTADGWTYREWLEAVANRVEEALRADNPESATE